MEEKNNKTFLEFDLGFNFYREALTKTLDSIRVESRLERELLYSYGGFVNGIRMEFLE